MAKSAFKAFVPCVCVCCVASVLDSATLRAIDHQTPLSMGFSGKNTGVGCHALLLGVFLTQGWNPLSLKSPALVGGFLTTGGTWEAPLYHNELLLWRRKKWIQILYICLK